jgi:hypothetical protein
MPVQKAKTKTDSLDKSADMINDYNVHKAKKAITNTKINKKDMNTSGLLDNEKVANTRKSMKSNKSIVKVERSLTPSKSRHLNTSEDKNRKDSSFVNSKMVIRRDPTHSIFKTPANEQFFSHAPESILFL